MPAEPGSQGQTDSANCPVDLQLRALDRSGLIGDITAVLAEAHGIVLEVRSHTDRKTMETVTDISLELPDLPTLSTVIAKLEALPNVVSARRKA